MNTIDIKYIQWTHQTCKGPLKVRRHGMDPPITQLFFIYIYTEFNQESISRSVT